MIIPTKPFTAPTTQAKIPGRLSMPIYKRNRVRAIKQK